jgi:hypothetical protein
MACGLATAFAESLFACLCAAAAAARLQLMTQNRLSTASDVYSYAIIMYEMLTWQMPFHDLSKEQVGIIMINACKQYFLAVVRTSSPLPHVLVVLPVQSRWGVEHCAATAAAGYVCGLSAHV